MTQPIIETRGLKKGYGKGPLVLKDLSLKFYPGEFTTILGLSGSGKSTFLRCINRLVEPTDGEILVPGGLIGKENAPIDVSALSQRQLRIWRQRVGMIFQQFNLVKRLSVLDNVLSGCLGEQNAFSSALRIFPVQAKELALRNLERVGLLDQAYQRADTLSGGQQQRVAIARALMQKPQIILADEPVASLDPRLSVTILDILKRIAQEDNIAVLISLHTLELAKSYSHRIIGLQDGNVVFDGPPEKLGQTEIDLIYHREAQEANA